MRSVGRPPVWAWDLVADVCAAGGVPAPTQLGWRRTGRAPSSGSTRYPTGRISVSAGTDELDARLTLLHELAHWLGRSTGRRGRGARHHDAAFWRRAFDLYAVHGVPGPAALRLEGRRYPGALRHARALGVPGAAEALAVHRAALRARPRRRWTIVVPEHQIRLVRDGRWTRCATCGHRLVGSHLARLRRRRNPGRHALLAAEPATGG